MCILGEEMRLALSLAAMVCCFAMDAAARQVEQACLSSGGSAAACTCRQDLAEKMLDQDVRASLAAFIREKKPPLDSSSMANVTVSEIMTQTEAWSLAVEESCP